MSVYNGNNFDNSCATYIEKELVDCSCQITFLASLFDSFKTPPASVLGIILGFAKTTYKTYNYCYKKVLNDGQVSNACLNALRVKMKTTYNVARAYPNCNWCIQAC